MSKTNGGGLQLLASHIPDGAEAVNHPAFQALTREVNSLKRAMAAQPSDVSRRTEKFEDRRSSTRSASETARLLAGKIKD